MKILTLLFVIAVLCLGAAACSTETTDDAEMAGDTSGDTTRCEFAGTGATLAFDGDRLNFTCDTDDVEVGLLGDVEMTDEGWAMEEATIGHGDEGAFIEDTEVVYIDFIELEDGTLCAFAGTGATAGYDDKRLNYTCDTKEASALFGEIETGDEGWVVDHAYYIMTDDGLAVASDEMALIAALLVNGE